MVKTSPSDAGGVGLIPCQEAKIPHASQPKNQNMKQKHCNKFNQDFKNGPHKREILKIKKESLSWPHSPLLYELPDGRTREEV